jgi:hypothetical protein
MDKTLSASVCGLALLGIVTACVVESRPADSAPPPPPPGTTAQPVATTTPVATTPTATAAPTTTAPPTTTGPDASRKPTASGPPKPMTTTAVDAGAAVATDAGADAS